MRTFSNILALFVIVLLAVSVTLNLVFIPKAIRKPAVQLQAYEKPVIINQLAEMPKTVENQLLRTELKPISEDTAGIRVYSDTIRNQDVVISFTNRVQGVLLSSKLDYKFSIPVINQVSPYGQTQVYGHDMSWPSVVKSRLYAVGGITRDRMEAGGWPNDYDRTRVQLGLFYVPGKSRFMAGYLHGFGPGRNNSFLIGYRF
ncbi:MAG: hypothetical protein AB7U05_09055 [Mangrovibacterium sp.]